MVCSRSLSETFYCPSPGLIKSRARDVSLRACAQLGATLTEFELLTTELPVMPVMKVWRPTEPADAKPWAKQGIALAYDGMPIDL